LSLWIAKQALDYEIDGAWKTAAFVFLAAWAVLAFSIYVSNSWDNRRRVMSIGWLLAGVLLWGVWWAYLPVPPTSSSPNPSQPPVASSSVAPSSPETAKRVFTDVDPHDLVVLYSKYSSAQADELTKSYIGKWITVTGRVSDVTRETSRFEPASVRLSIYIEAPNKEPDTYVVVAAFQDQASIDRALILRKNESVTISGQIKSVIQPGIVLENSEFKGASK
jgi:hypothetical protein